MWPMRYDSSRQGETVAARCEHKKPLACRNGSCRIRPRYMRPTSSAPGGARAQDVASGHLEVWGTTRMQREPSETAEAKP